MKKKFIISTEIDERLIERILKALIYYEDTGKDWDIEFTFLSIAEKLKMDINRKDIWQKLRMHLYFMERDGLIEERHFPNGIVDYSAEQSGIDLLKKLEAKGKI